MAARPEPMANVVTIVRLTLMPTSVDASLFSDTARMARPSFVFCTKICSAAMTTAAMTIVITAAMFTDTPPMDIGAVLKISSEITRGFGPMAGMACARFSSSRLMAMAVMRADMLVPLRRTGR